MTRTGGEASTRPGMEPFEMVTADTATNTEARTLTEPCIAKPTVEGTSRAMAGILATGEDNLNPDRAAAYRRNVTSRGRRLEA